MMPLYSPIKVGAPTFSFLLCCFSRLFSSIMFLSSLLSSLFSTFPWKGENRDRGLKECLQIFPNRITTVCERNKSYREQGLKKIQKQLPFWSKLKTKASDASRLLMTNWVIYELTHKLVHTDLDRQIAFCANNQIQHAGWLFPWS